DPLLQQRPKPFHRVRMRVSAYPNPHGVAYALVAIPKLRELRVGLQLVGEDHGCGKHASLNDRDERAGVVVGNDGRFDLRGLVLLATLSHPEDRGLHRWLLMVLSPDRLSADICLVYLDRPGERIVALVEQRTDLIEHAPRGRVSDGDRAPQLLRGVAASRAGR